MSLTMTLILVGCVIIILFSTEFFNLGKKILKIRGMSLFLPLLLASTVVIDFQNFWLKDILWITRMFKCCVDLLQQWLPFSLWGLQVSGLVIMMAFALIPQSIIKVVYKKRGAAPFEYPGYLSIVMWSLAAFFYVLTILTYR